MARQPKRPPITISIDDPVKIKGQSLKGKSEFRKPVNREMSDNVFNAPNTVQYTACVVGL